MELKFRAIYEGRDADDNRLEAYPAAQSMEGLVWALSLVVHYGVTGQLRNRGDLSGSARIYVKPSRQGSYFQDIILVVQQNPFLAGVAGGYAANVVTPYLNGLVSYTFNQTLGAAKALPRGAGKFIRGLNREDLAELSIRIEPPLTRAHAAIGRSAETLTFKSKRTPLVLMNTSTKAYLEAQLSADFDSIDTNITSFNVLTGNGRLYYPDIDGTVAFSLDASASPGAKQALIRSMEHYAMGHAGFIRITARRFEAVDGRIKKLVVRDADEIPIADWEGDSDPLRKRRN